MPHEEPQELFIELELRPEGISWILVPVITECIETAQDQEGRHRWMWTAALDRVPIIKLGCQGVQAPGRIGLQVDDFDRNLSRLCCEGDSPKHRLFRFP